MLTCSKIKQKLNLALLNGEKALILKKGEATKEELADIEECGYIVIEKKNRIIIRE